MNIDIESIAEWGPPNQVPTRFGTRILRTAKVFPDGFWDVWKQQKNELKNYGVAVAKDPDSGEWKLNWWREANRTNKAEAVKESQLAETDYMPPLKEGGLVPFPYQRAGVQYALDKEGVLFGDEPGLGKSAQSLLTCNAMDSHSILIVCPASLKINWHKECKLWLKEKYRVTMVNRREWDCVENPHITDRRVLITNYDMIWKEEIISMIRKVEWDSIILDEAHKIKNGNKVKCGAVIVGNREMPPLKAKKRMALTGTPIPNCPVEIFPIIKWLNPAVWGNWKHFTERYCDAKRGFGGATDVKGSSNLSELNFNLRSSVMIMRTRDQVLPDLPPITRQIIEFPSPKELKMLLNREKQEWEMHTESKQALDAARKDAENIGDMDAFKNAGSKIAHGITAAFAAMSKIRAEIAAAKVPMVIDHTELMLESTESIVIFCHHIAMVNGLMEGLKKYNPVKLVGGMTDAEKNHSVEAFQAGRARVFIGNFIAAGVGITLTKAYLGLMAEQDWVPANLIQAEGRLRRIGQRSNVLIQYLVCEGSLDGTMMNKVVRKMDVIDQATGYITDIAAASQAVDSVQPTNEQAYKMSAEEEAKKKARRDRFAAIGNKLTSDQKEAVEDGLREVLSKDTDRASIHNAMGFNKIDGTPARDMIGIGWRKWSPVQAGYSWYLANKYRNQIDSRIYAGFRLTEVVEDE